MLYIEEFDYGCPIHLNDFSLTSPINLGLMSNFSTIFKQTQKLDKEKKNSIHGWKEFLAGNNRTFTKKNPNKNKNSQVDQ